MINQNCPICHAKMKKERRTQLDAYDYFCEKENHFACYRIDSRDKMRKLKIRFTDNLDSIRLLIHYDYNYSEIWGNTNTHRVKVNQIIEPDFTQLEALKQQLKVYLLIGT